MPFKSRSYAAIKAVSDELGLPQAFRKDLTVHDRRALQAVADDAPFAWYVYPNGTHLIFPQVREARGRLERHQRASPQQVAEAFEGGQWFWWDGLALTALSSAGAVDDKLRDAELAIAAKLFGKGPSCPECGTEGPHDDNGEVGRFKSYCCRECGAHFDSPED